MEIVKVDYSRERPMVSGRDLHRALEIKTPYTQQFERMCDYGFEETRDFLLVSQKSETNNPKNPWTEITNHQLTLDMAKEICIIQHTKIGNRCQAYFLKIERKWNSPEAEFARALRRAKFLSTTRTSQED